MWVKVSPSVGRLVPILAVLWLYFTIAQANLCLHLETKMAGIYTLSHSRLVEFGWPNRTVPISRIELTRDGAPAKLQLSDNKLHFEPGDRLLFAANGIQKHETRLYDFSNTEAFRLVLLDESGQSWCAESNTPIETNGEGPSSAPSDAMRMEWLFWRQHWEENNLLLSGKQNDAGNWVWYKLHQLQTTAFQHTFRAPQRDRLGKQSHVTIGFRGWSSPKLKHGGFDHVVSIRLNKKSLGRLEWDGRQAKTFSTSFSNSLLSSGNNLLEIQVEQRKSEEGLSVIDIVYLDGIQLDMGLTRIPGDAVGRFFAAETIPLAKHEGSYLQDQEEPSGWFWYAGNGRERQPAVISPIKPPPAIAAVTEYLIISPRDFTAAAERLARYHSANGRPTQVIMIEELYAHYANGFRTPWAIRRFLERWRTSSPNARFVLLLGDADAYAKLQDKAHGNDSAAKRRDWIPTWQRQTLTGPAASDNWFVADLNDLERPWLAIGRLAVSSRVEADAQVTKTLQYLKEASAYTPLKQQLLLLSDQHVQSQKFIRDMATHSSAMDFSFDQYLAKPISRDSGKNQEQVRRLLSSDYPLILFYGHGGRYMWRTGAENLETDKDLFGLKEVATLPTPEVLPVIVSLSCTTVPFDHPVASSLGEAFLSSDDGGAVAFIGSSTLNRPSKRFATEMVERMLAGETIGEAMLHSKRSSPSLKMIFSYNLLGDPALTLKGAKPRRARPGDVH